MRFLFTPFYALAEPGGELAAHPARSRDCGQPLPHHRGSGSCLACLRLLLESMSHALLLGRSSVTSPPACTRQKNFRYDPLVEVRSQNLRAGEDLVRHLDPDEWPGVLVAQCKVAPDSVLEPSGCRRALTLRTMPNTLHSEVSGEGCAADRDRYSDRVPREENSSACAVDLRSRKPGCPPIAVGMKQAGHRASTGASRLSSLRQRMSRYGQSRCFVGCLTPKRPRW